MPDGVDDEDASFVTLGAIALQGIRQAQPTLGERIVVVGLGLLGLLTVQLLKANGCRVFGFDPAPERARLACQLGADAARHEGLAEGVKAFTGGLGADAVIITASTKSDEPVNTAAEIARFKARIVVVGFVGMNLRRDLYYRKELDLRLSMSYGPGRYDPRYEEHGQDYPIAYVRWTEQRNMQAFLELVRDGRVTPKALITHRFTIHEAEQAYALLASKEPNLGIVLTYPEDRAAAPLRQIRVNEAPARAQTAPIGVGFIGAGNFARSVLLPQVARTAGLRFTGVATATGMSGRHVADKYGFGQVTTDYHQILDDPATDAVFIVTRHASHAPIACDALRAGKAVFVEKPLACDLAQLTEVVEHGGGHRRPPDGRVQSPVRAPDPTGEGGLENRCGTARGAVSRERRQRPGRQLAGGRGRRGPDHRRGLPFRRHAAVPDRRRTSERSRGARGRPSGRAVDPDDVR